MDFDERYIEYGRSQGIEITQGGIENVAEGKKFDLIIISHVLEHIVDPSAFLKDTKKLLKESGKIYIEVPSLNQVLSGGYDFDLLLYFQNAHVIHYSVETLSNLIRQCSLNVLKMDDLICCICEKDDAHIIDEDGPYKGLFKKQEDLLVSIERRRWWRQFPLPIKISKKFIKKFI